MVIEGLSFSTYDNGQLVNRISAEHFIIRPRNLGPFRVRSINEAAIYHAVFVFYRRDSATEADDSSQDQIKSASLEGGLAAGIKGLASTRGAGRVTRAVIERMTLEIRDEEELLLSLEAERATLDFPKRENQFVAVTMENGTKTLKVEAETVFWLDREKIFYIPGAFNLFEAEDSTSGEGLIIDMDFNLTAIDNKN